MKSDVIGKPRVLFLLPVLGQPRHAKRIDGLIAAGLEVEVLAFSRNYPTGRQPSVPVTLLGNIEHRKYLRRIPTLLRATGLIRKRSIQFDIIYCFGLDLAIIAQLGTLGNTTKIVLEVGDISDIEMKSGFIGSIFRLFERILFRNINLLVLISEGFVDFYINKFAYKGAHLIIENKIQKDYTLVNNSNPSECQESQLLERPLTIGYFGMLRDNWGWSVLRQLAICFPNKYRIVLAGRNFGLKDFDHSISNFENIQYLGEYSSPSGLSDIYSKIDMVWICYDPIKEFDINLMSGRPNRFYESCYFGKPVFARRSVAFARDVERYDIGCCLESISEAEAITEILNVSFEDVKRWQKQMKILPRNVFIETDENIRLIAELNGLFQ